MQTGKLRPGDALTIGQLAKRTGLSVSAIRFYEAQGLIHPGRNAGGQRRFLRSDIRRISFVLITQKLGFTLGQIRGQLEKLPDQRTPTKADWSRISRAMRADLDARIETLTRMRAYLDGCIGCGCMSLRRCALLNPEDRAGAAGTGPRYLLGDDPDPADQAG